MAIPHLAIPIRFTTISGNVAAAVNEQDSYDEVYDCVQTIARYNKGDIEEEPDFGVTDQTFSVILDARLLGDELVAQEPRALGRFAIQADQFDTMIQRIMIDVYDIVEGA